MLASKQQVSFHNRCMFEMLEKFEEKCIRYFFCIKFRLIFCLGKKNQFLEQEFHEPVDVILSVDNTEES